MQLRRSAAIVGGVALIGAWLASAAGLIRGVQDPPRPVVVVPTSGAESLAEDVQAQSARLRERLNRAPSPQPDGRNPFRFEPRPVVERRVAPAPPVPSVPPVTISTPPPLKLEGLAERDLGGRKTRIAIVSHLNEIFFAAEGETVAGGYRLKAIGADAVELEEIATGTLVRLAIR